MVDQFDSDHYHLIKQKLYMSALADVMGCI